MALLLELQARGDPRDAPADDEDLPAGLLADLLQGLQCQAPLVAPPDDALRLPGGLLGGVGSVDPAALLPDVGELEEVGVEPRPLQDVLECGEVHPRGAGGDDDPVESVPLDVREDGVLGGLGAEVAVLPRDRDVVPAPDLLPDLLDVHDVPDVPPALAEVDPDLSIRGHCHPFVSWINTIKHSCG